MNKFNREDIHELLMELGYRMKLANVEGTIFIYGGAVMCSAFEIRESTSDIDCVYNELAIIKIVNQMAKEFGLSHDWINDAVKEIVYEDMVKQEVGDIWRYHTLLVRVPSAKQMLAMKLFSARKDRDLADAVQLAIKIGVFTDVQLKNVLLEFFKQNSIRTRNKRYKNIIGRFMLEVSEEIKKYVNKSI